MNDRFSSLQLFVRVARTGSFSIAGRELGLSQPTASRIVAALEKKVGVALLTRSTRAVTVTEAGADYLARAEVILAAMDEADHAARGTGELRGILRIATSSAFANRAIFPRLARFTDMHPALRVEFILNDRRQDLIGDAVDAAMRVGLLADSSAVARKIGVVHRVLAASPSYLQRAGLPNAPTDLPNHACIVGPASQGLEGWAFEKDGKKTSIRIEGRFILNGTDSATKAAVAGLGIVSSTHLSCLEEFENGSLVRVLPEWEMGEADVNVVLPAGRAAKPSARAFSNFMVAEFKAIEDDFGPSWPHRRESRGAKKPLTRRSSAAVAHSFVE
jgi:DNA-binding transcriptional LysR family regulator